MKVHETKTWKFSALVLIAAVFFAAVSPHISTAQTSMRLFGELTVVQNGLTANGGGFVTVDGARAESGRSVMSPSDVVTPPDAGAKISFAQTGTLTLAPNTAMNLTFVNSSIAGDLTNGEVTLETIPNTALNIFTRDGAIWTPNRNQRNTVKISVQNGATRVSVIDGQVMFNKVVVSAGETYPNAGSGAGGQTSSSGTSPLLIAGIAGAVVAVVIIALTVSNNDDNVVSATR